MSQLPPRMSTRAKNATQRPGLQILAAEAEAYGINKRRTKGEKAADDQRAKDAKDAHEAAIQDGYQRITAMQSQTQAAQADTEVNAPKPRRPQPRPAKAKAPVAKAKAPMAKAKKIWRSKHDFNKTCVFGAWARARWTEWSVW
ncbi:hypothetical protein BV22DRAFT_1134547 [Leucogyrophana mollusca]|uniref:Uncharacterized protein n=1 Tax=Leucogyrophana mollusca TaxID=85980 RepID=A0ACB8AYK7_9AGAM|nr:hypothetical protein BV22DRAFT_1134547 [Leucogyrophana mollusca]